MKFRIFFLLFFLAQVAFSQQVDSLYFTLFTDTLFQKSIGRADSIALEFQRKADSLNNEFQQQLSKIDEARNSVQKKIDSISTLKLPTEKLTKRLDSLLHIRSEKINSLTHKVEDLKANATQRINGLNLPKELKEPLNILQSSIKEYSLPALGNTQLDFSKVTWPKIDQLKLPTLGKQLNLNSNITDKLGNINNVAGSVGGYAKDAQSLAKGNIDEVKHLDKSLESKVLGMEGMDQLQKGKALLATDSAAMANKAKELVKEQVMNAAQDHFAGKQELLQQAMDKMTKLKGRYSEVASMADLPKKLPNPLKGKPLIERLVPSIGYQVQKSGSFLLDISPLLLYKITPRISAGAGWNHRLAIDHGQWQQNESIYGPRLALEVKLAKGFNVRLLPEIMNTTIPPLIAQSKGVDVAFREWIPSLFMGMKKDFRIYKQLQGYSEVLYNLYDKDGMSLYGDKLSMRFGFEFPMKKRKDK